MQTLDSELPKTIGRIREEFNNWYHAGIIKTNGKNFNNVENFPFFASHPPETSILKITPPPELHLMAGIFNHILKGMEDIYEYHKNACHEYALNHNCIRESYHAKYLRRMNVQS